MRSNQAMQLTASKSAIYVLGVYHPRFSLGRPAVGLEQMVEVVHLAGESGI